MSKQETKEAAEKNKKRRMLYINDADLLIPAWGIVTVEKDVLLVHKPTVHWEYGIVINKGMESSSTAGGMSIGERSVWYTEEKTRDRKFEAMLNILMEENYNVTVI